MEQLNPDEQLFFSAFKASPVGIALEDLEGRPLFANPALCSMLGFTEEEFRSKHCVEFSPAEDAEKDWALFQQLRAGAIDHYHLDKRFFRRDGSLIWGHLSISLLTNGTSPLVVAMVEDITEQKRMEEALNSRSEFESLVSDLSRTFVSLPEKDVDANIERNMARIGELLGMDRITLYELSGDSAEIAATYSWNHASAETTSRLVMTEALPWWWDRVHRGRTTFLSQLNDLPQEASLEKEFLHQRGVISVASIPLQGSGDFSGVIVFVTTRRQVSWKNELTNQLEIISDIFWNALKRKRSMEALLATQAIVLESEERFRLAAQAGKMYAFEWDVLTDVIERSGDPDQIVGSDGLMQSSSQRVWTQVHPDDREKLKAATAKLSPEEPHLRITHRMIRQDGEVIWVERNCRAHFDQQRRVVRIVGMVADVTERRRTEEALRESEELLQMATRSGRMFAYEWDAATDKIVRSQGASEVLGKEEGTYTTGRHILDMIPAEDRERVSHAIAELSPERPFLQVTYRMLRSDGNVIWLDRNSRAYFDRDGRLIRLVGMLADVTDRVRAGEMLRQKDTELSEAQRLAQVGSWRWDARDDTVAWSEELYRIAGLDPALPLPGFSELRLQFTVESRDRLQRAVETALRDRTSYELDLEIVRPDGDRRWVTARGEVVSDFAGNVIGLRGTSQDITERKLAEEALSKVSQKLIEAQEQERSRLARELHDDINQRLALLSIQLHTLRPEEVRKQLDELLSDIQALSHRLHSPKLDYLGLPSAAAGFCRELADQQDIDIDFHSENVPDQLPPEIALCLFRVLQEALQNAIKHSGSPQYQVSLKADEHEVELTVDDSGVGFDVVEAMKGSGLGLTSMQERLKLVDGQLSIDSQLHRGTTIRARVPLPSHTRSLGAAG